MRTALSVALALAAAALYGTSSVLQQEAVRREAEVALLRPALLGRLARQPRWVAATALSAFSFGVQAAALAFGPLALVQPVAATDLLFAMPLLARRRRFRLGTREWAAAAVVAGSIAAFLALAPPSGGRVAPGIADWAWPLVVVGAAVAIVGPASLRAPAAVRTGLLAGLAGAVFAVLDALTKSVVGLVGEHGVGVLAHWEPYGMTVAAATGILLGQSAFRSGSLLVGLPIIDSVEPVGAVLLGAVVFSEHIARSPLVLAGQVVAGAAAVVGIVVLDRSTAARADEADGPGAPGP